jgi:hypothetical protein
LLDSNYFVEDAVNTPKEFMRHFTDEQENTHENSVQRPRVRRLLHVQAILHVWVLIGLEMHGCPTVDYIWSTM